MDVRTVPVYTAREFSELTGTPMAKSLILADRAQPNRRVFSWSDALQKLAEDLSSQIDTVLDNGNRLPIPPLAPLQEAERILRRGGRAFRDLNESLEYISVDPERLSASPEIRGTRVHAFFVGMEARRPGGWKTLLHGYNLTHRQINDAVDWTEKVISYAAA